MKITKKRPDLSKMKDKTKKRLESSKIKKICRIRKKYKNKKDFQICQK